jgi:hypothetical protein
MIYVAIPTYDGKLHHTTVGGLLDVMHYLTKHGIGMCVDVIPHDAFIGRARNLACKRFLASGATDLVFIDADVGFQVPDFALLMKQDVDICGGIYCFKKDDPGFPALYEQPIERYGPLVKMIHVPGGFMRIRRKVLTRIMELDPENQYYDNDHKALYNFFPFGPHGSIWVGEDVGFCRQAKKHGFSIWGVEMPSLTHTGDKTWNHVWHPQGNEVKEAA